MNPVKLQEILFPSSTVCNGFC